MADPADYPLQSNAAAEVCKLSLLKKQHRSLHFSVSDQHAVFSTAELLEIGDVPFSTPNDKPFRHEALAYYRKVATHYNLNIQHYEEAQSIHRQDDGTFTVHTLSKGK